MFELIFTFLCLSLFLFMAFLFNLLHKKNGDIVERNR